MARTTKIDWLKAKKDYISDPTLSYEKVAKKYGVAKKTVEVRSQKEGWINLRQEIAEKGSALAQERMVEQIAEVEVRHADSHKLLQNLELQSVSILVGELEAKREAAKITGTRLTWEDIPSPHRTKALAEALDISINGERKALGLPSTITKMDSALTFHNEFERFDRNIIEGMLYDDLTTDNRSTYGAKPRRLAASTDSSSSQS